MKSLRGWPRHRPVPAFSFYPFEFSLAAHLRSEERAMRTIICNITNLDATIAAWSLQSIVRGAASAASVVRGVSRFVRESLAPLMRLLADGMAKPAYATLPSVAARAATQQPGCCHRCDGQAGYLGNVIVRPERVGRS